MPHCDYCGKELNERDCLQKDNRFFCDNLCRHSFDDNGGKPKLGPSLNKSGAVKKPPRKSAWVAPIVGALVAAAVGLAVQQGTKGFFSPKLTSMKLLNATANQINSSLPMMLDSDTELFTTVGLEGVLQYHYRLVKYSKEQIDTSLLMPTLRESITNSSCTIKDTRALLEKGVTLEYVYHDKDKKMIASFSLKNITCIDKKL